MPTYTDNFGFPKPLIDSLEEEDQWGGILNQALDDIDAALYGKRSQLETVQVISADATADLYAYYVLTAELTLTLPASPSAGDWVRISNRSGTKTGTVARNGANIMGLAEDMVLNIEDAGFTMTYVDSTQGWVIA